MKTGVRISDGEWKAVALGEVATIERSAIQPKEITKGTAYLGLEHIESGGKILGAKPVDEGELASSKFKFTERHVLYGKLRPYLAKISCPDFSGICSTDILPILPGPNLDRGYLCYFLRQPSMIGYASSRAVGINLPRIAPSTLAEFRIPLPPLAEQRRIAEVLDRAEALRAKRRAALAQLDSLTQFIFLDLFGDPVSNPKRWPQENLGTFFHFRTGKLDSNAAVVSGEYPFFTCSRENFRIDTFAFDCEALLLAGNNASADYSVKHYKGKFNAYQRTYVITLRDERNSYEYSRFVLEHRLTELKRISKGTNTKYLTMELLNRIRVPAPPIDLQREFARRVVAVEKLKAAQRASLVEMDALFASLQYRAFRGEL